MTEIQQNRYDRLIRRVANIVGGGSQVNDTLNELFPVLDVENVPGELLLPMGTRICFGGATVTGDATQAGRIMLFNPVATNLIATVTTVLIGSGADAIIRFGINNTPLTTVINTETIRDLRELQPQAPVMQMRSQITVALAASVGSIRLLTNTTVTLQDPNGLFVLAPGTGIEFGPAAFNIQLNVTFFWRERVAEPAELNM